MGLLGAVLGHRASYEWIGVLLARLSVGLLFFLSGRRKLFQPAARLQMRQTLEEAHIPFAKQTAVAVSCVEFICGGLLVVGALTPLAALLLGGDMVVALATSRVQTIRASSVAEWLLQFLFLPEVLYLVLLVWLFVSGAGWLSVDQAWGATASG